MEQEELSEITIDDILNQSKLILYNDSHNSFDSVVMALMMTMKYDHIQAEQLAVIAHNKGKALIKTGNFSELEKYHSKLGELDITTEIQ